MFGGRCINRNHSCACAVCCSLGWHSRSVLLQIRRDRSYAPPGAQSNQEQGIWHSIGRRRRWIYNVWRRTHRYILCCDVVYYTADSDVLCPSVGAMRKANSEITYELEGAGNMEDAKPNPIVTIPESQSTHSNF